MHQGKGIIGKKGAFSGRNFTKRYKVFVEAIREKESIYMGALDKKSDESPII